MLEFLLLVLIIAVLATTAWAGWSAAPFIPARQRDMQRILRLAELKPGQVLYDLGAGDGRIVVAAAKLPNVQAVGFEIALPAVIMARWKIWRSGVGAQASIRMVNFFQQDFSAADVVVCFLTPKAMAKLGPIFRRQLRPGTKVLSYAFAIPEWPVVAEDKPTPKDLTIYAYRA